MTGSWEEREAERYRAERAALVSEVCRYVPDVRILEALGKVPRERFLAPEWRTLAYEDRPLPIGHGQTTSQPTMIALMLQELRLTGSEKVLEVGAGCGYQTALIAELAREVVGVELIRPLAELATRVLRELGYTNARIEVATEELGWSADAPYDAIVVAAAAPRIPASLIAQLAPGGRLAIPVGDRGEQELLVAEKLPEGVTVTRKGGCSFVPLLGNEAFNGSL